MEKTTKTSKSRGGRKKNDEQSEREKRLLPLRCALERISDMLCEFSGERELFICGGKPEKRLDTKTLKEFSSVLKEISAVAVELSGDGQDRSGSVHIEFSDDALDMSS